MVSSQSSFVKPQGQPPSVISLAASYRYIATAMIEPLTPMMDPCSPSTSYDDISNKVMTWIIYLAIREPPQFAAALARCKTLAGSGDLSSCLQLDGTRHVSLWEGPMTQEQARQIRLVDEDAELDFPISVKFSGWIPRGGYLQLDAATETKLKVQ